MAISGCLLFLPGLAAAQQTYQETGKTGDLDSWRSAEFKANWALSAMKAEYAYARGLSGQGASLGLLDTGVALDHKEFRNGGHVSLHLGEPSCGEPDTIIFRPGKRCFASDGNQPFVSITVTREPQQADVTAFEYSDHGTHVGGSMVAGRDGQGMHGVAFGSRLISARYYGDRLTFESTDEDGMPDDKRIITPNANTVAAISEAYQKMHDHGVHAVNFEVWIQVKATPASANTVGALNATYRRNQAYMDSLVDASIKHDIVTVVAAGNDYGRIANIYPSLPVFRSDAEANWLAVVNVNAKNTLDTSSSRCAQSKNWCIAAPGTDIYSTYIKGGIGGTVAPGAEPAGDDPIRVDLKRGTPTLDYAKLTGTSMAAPQAIGALALVMERYPYLTAMQARDVLLTTAQDIGEPGIDETFGWGLIDLKKGMEGYGQLRVDTDVVMNAAAGGAKIWSGDAWDDWRNDIGGPGHLHKSGAGWLRLSGANTFAGASVSQGVLELAGTNTLADAVEVDGGELLLSGVLQDTALDVQSGRATILGEVKGGETWVAAQARLQGTGTLAATDMAGIVAPGGAAIGTLHINGAYVQRMGSVYEANVSAPATSDQLAVQGKATLEGGTVEVVTDPGRALLGQRYTLLTATGGVHGQFAEVAQNDALPFLKWQLQYAPQTVQLDVVRGKLLSAAARTPNQTAVARAADRAPMQTAMPQLLTQLRWEQAAPALDSASGEIHPSTQAVLVQAGTMVREVVAARSRTTQDAFTRQAAVTGPHGVWVDVAQVGGHLQDDSGNAARTRYNASAQLLGYDYQFERGASLGVVAGRGKADAQLDARASRSEISSRYWGVYGGQRWGGPGVRAGVLQAQDAVRTQRSVAIASHTATPQARYNANAQQRFVEGGYQWQSSGWAAEPYLQWAHVRQRHGTLVESGGVEALTGAPSRQHLSVYTAGLRVGALLGLNQQQTWLNINGGLAYRRTQGDLAAMSQLHWNAGDAFDVSGVPLAASTTLVDLGVGARLSRRTLLELGYRGQFHRHGHADSLSLRYSLQF